MACFGRLERGAGPCSSASSSGVRRYIREMMSRWEKLYGSFWVDIVDETAKAWMNVYVDAHRLVPIVFHPQAYGTCAA